jgi:hypothetical protein
VVHRLLADAVMLAHFGFLVFVVLGGFLAWRYRWVIGPHAAAVAWGLLSALGAVQCPLTDWEDGFRRLAGEQGVTRGFIDFYLTGAVYPREHLVTVQLIAAGLVAVSWAGFVLLRRRASPSRAHPARASAVDVRASTPDGGRVGPEHEQPHRYGNDVHGRGRGHRAPDPADTGPVSGTTGSPHSRAMAGAGPADPGARASTGPGTGTRSAGGPAATRPGRPP